MSDTIKKLADLFSKFTTVGPRTANRFVYYLLTLPKEKIDELTNTIQELKNKIKSCSFCFNYYEDNDKLCSICRNHLRNKQLLCVVEKETDLSSIENTKKYNGLYFILGGVLNFKKNNIDTLRINELKERIENPQKFGLPIKTGSQEVSFEEIIIAINPTPEGKATSILIERELKQLTESNFSAKGGPASGWKITHLAKGLPVGGELEYADQETLESAFEGRK